MSVYLEILKGNFQEDRIDELVRTAAGYLNSGTLTKEEYDSIFDFMLSNIPEERLEKLIAEVKSRH